MEWREREELKAMLRKKGSSFAIVARQLKLSRAAVSMVVAGRRSRRIEELIAEILGLPLQEVWPDRYREEGEQDSHNLV